MPMAGDFLRTKRDREDQLNTGIVKSLRGQLAINDLSSHPEEWGLERIKASQKEAQRVEDEREAGSWPM